jgi:hypothetical protein
MTDERYGFRATLRSIQQLDSIPNLQALRARIMKQFDRDERLPELLRALRLKEAELASDAEPG